MSNRILLSRTLSLTRVRGLVPGSRPGQSLQRARFRRSPGTNRPVVAIPIADQCLFFFSGVVLKTEREGNG